jgi:hypothetical protein
MAEVYGRYMEAMSDGAIDSTDVKQVQVMLREGALVIDEQSGTISIGNQRRFDDVVDRYSRIWSPQSKSVARLVETGLLDSDERTFDQEWMDGDWRYHRRFGKAIVTDDEDIQQWWWRGGGASCSLVVRESLHEVSGGKVSIWNFAAAEFLCENSALGDDGAMRLEGFEHDGRRDFAEVLLERFPNPADGEVLRTQGFSDPKTPTRPLWVKVGAGTHRSDGAASWSGPDGFEVGVYYLDNVSVDRERVLARLVKERAGIEIRPDNREAIATVESLAGVDYGSIDNEFAITVDGELASAAEAALLMHHNPVAQS